MGRPNRQHDKKLIEAGIKIFKLKGISGLTIKEVCSEAKVNSGMFIYFFKTKDNFAKVIFSNIYNEFFEQLKASSIEGSPIEQLTRVIKKLANFAYENRTTVQSIIKDVLFGEKVTMDLVQENVPKEFNLFLEIITRCKENNLLRDDISGIDIISSIGSIPLSILIATSEIPKKILNKKELVGIQNIEKFIDIKVDILIKGILK